MKGRNRRTERKSEGARSELEKKKRGIEGAY